MTAQSRFAFPLVFIGLLTPVTLAEMAFDDHVAYDTGSLPVGVVIGDLDGDNVADVATANSSAQDISIRFGIGDGSLGPETRLDPGTGHPRQLAIGDLDADGDPDLVAAIRDGTGSVAVMLNEGSSQFSTPVQVGSPNLTFALELVDLDGDGDLDVAVVGGFIEIRVEILLNDGTGMLSPVGSHTAIVTDFTYIADVSAGDIDGDGLPDLAVVAAVTTGAIVTFRNLGNGEFLGPVPVDLSVSNPTGVLLHDLTGDGIADLAVTKACLGEDEVVISLNDGQGDFGPGASNPVGSLCHSFTNPFALEAGDLDLDGTIDLVVVSRNDDQARVLLNRGAGAFSAPLSLPVDNEPIAAAVGDLNADGRDDIVTANVAMITGNGSASVLLNISSVPCAADVNGDGNVDVNDFLELLAGWGENPGHPGDLNGDGIVDVNDFLELLAGWGPCP
ncbi:MAG: FG-GAP-like repeat-containing protein [Planctomycetota bacterium]|jgi:hypothetical protein